MAYTGTNPFSVSFTAMKLRYHDYDNSIESLNFLNPTDKVNVFINFESVLNNLSMMRDIDTKLLLERKFPTIFESEMINLCAHYKKFFRGNGLDTKVFLYYTDLSSPDFINYKYNDEYRSYYINKYLQNPKFQLLGNKLLDVIIPRVQKIYSTKTPFTQWHLQNWMCDTFRSSFESEWTKIPIFNNLNTAADIEKYLKTHADEIAKGDKSDSQIEIGGDSSPATSDNASSPKTPAHTSGSLPGVKAVSLSGDKSNPKVGAHPPVSDDENDDDVELVPESGPTVDDPNLLRFKREERNSKIRKCLVAAIILFCICLIVSPAIIIMDIIKLPKPEPVLPKSAELNFVIIPEDAANVNFALYKCPDGKCNIDENTPPLRTGNTVKTTLKNLEAGSYQIDLKVSQYKDESYMFTLENGSTETRFEMQYPIPQVATLTINVDPEDLHLYYTGKMVRDDPNKNPDTQEDVNVTQVTDYVIPAVGNTRTIKGIVGDSYTIRAFKAGYEPVESSDTILDNTTLSMELLTPSPFDIELMAPTRLPITLSSGGKVIRKGETPMTFDNVDTTNPVTIEIRRGSAVVWKQDIDFSQVETTSLRYFADI